MVGSLSLLVTHYAANFGGFRHCGSRDITYLSCQVIWCYHVRRRLYDFMGSTHHLAKSHDHRPFGNIDKTYLICHVISCDHVFRGLCNFTCGNPL